jgi:rare lipoprotein A (peptidoglycan hydrolase)
MVIRMSVVKLMVLTAMFAHYQAGEPVDLPSVQVPPVQQAGVASWYGGGSGDNGMHGRRTATGELFDPSLRTCASRSIPLNTMVLVEVVKTGNRAFCRVNDRGPYGANLHEGGWGIKVPISGGQYLVRQREGGGWGPKRYVDESPGRWRGVMDLSKGCAEALNFDFRSGLNKIKVRYWRDRTPSHVLADKFPF